VISFSVSLKNYNWGERGSGFWCVSLFVIKVVFVRGEAPCMITTKGLILWYSCCIFSYRVTFAGFTNNMLVRRVEFPLTYFCEPIFKIKSIWVIKNPETRKFDLVLVIK
jgi:hypothetical protein